MKQYIGDSVYVDYDGYSFVLTTQNGYHDDPRNRIVLEPEVFEALDRYVKSIALGRFEREQDIRGQGT